MGPFPSRWIIFAHASQPSCSGLEGKGGGQWKSYKILRIVDGGKGDVQPVQKTFQCNETTF